MHHCKIIGEFKLELQSRNSQFGSKLAIFYILCDLEIWCMTLENNRAPLLYHTKRSASLQSHRLSQTWVTVRKRSIRVKIGIFFVPCDLQIWWMTLKNNSAPLLCPLKLCASFHSHWWIQTGVKVRKRPIRVKIGNFLSRAILKFNGWHWKTIRHLSYAASSFVHHFIAIGESKMELQSGNAKFGSKLKVFLAVWLWNLTENIEKQKGHLF